ncbi:MAG: acyl-CoA dehydrogenase family protein [Phenylobacterium sp.]
MENGYAARTIPREYGGYGAEPDILKSRIIAEEFARAQLSPGLGGQGISMLVPTLLEVGSEEQKRQFIAPTLRGEMPWPPRPGESWARANSSAMMRDFRMSGSAPKPPYSRGMVRAA